MSEMIKRVARALCKADGHDPDGPTSDIFVPGDPDAGLPWAGYRRQARAAIETVREPTDEQRNRYFEMKIAAGGWPGNAVFVDAEWERMVDAALAEPKA